MYQRMLKPKWARTIAKATPPPMDKAMTSKTCRDLIVPSERVSICWTKTWTAGSAKTPKRPKSPPIKTATGKNSGWPAAPRENPSS
jgi:hypothetical protein